MGQSKGQASSLEQKLLMMQARQPQPPKAPQAQKKGLPRFERMDTRDSLTEMDTRDSFTAPAKPLSTPIPEARLATRAARPPPPPPPPAAFAAGACDAAARSRWTRTP